MPEILICQRRGNLKRQNLCTLMMIFQASDEQALRREPWITSHHVHNALCSSTKAQFCFPVITLLFSGKLPQPTISSEPSF